jgi:hypothetical protein
MPKRRRRHIVVNVCDAVYKTHRREADIACVPLIEESTKCASFEDLCIARPYVSHTE